MTRSPWVEQASAAAFGHRRQPPLRYKRLAMLAMLAD